MECAIEQLRITRFCADEGGAAVSIMVAAVNRLGGTCIQEYKAKKLKNGNDCKGLCDASLSYLFKGKRVDFDAEAKQIMMPIRAAADGTDQLEAAILESERCVNQLAVTGERLAVLFVTFTAYSSEEQRSLHDAFPGADKSLRKVIEKGQGSAAGLYLSDRQSVKYLPGAAILLKEIE